jgi:short-subunit dehydrogenase
MRDLQGRTALVTGASKGIGIYIARALAAEGMNLILAARSGDKLESLAGSLRADGCRVLCIPTDLSDRASLEALAKRAEQEQGGVDLLVNNAGAEHWSAFDQLSVEAIDQLIAINLSAPIVLSRLLLPSMIRRGRGHIVNIASVAGLGGVAYAEPYCATKHALVGFTRSFRATALSEGYRVGCSAVCPGLVADAGMYDDISREFDLKAPPLLGTSSPKRVAKVVVRAVKRDLPEIVVNPMPIRPLVVLALFAPRFALRLIMKLGGRFFREAAKQRAGSKP